MNSPLLAVMAAVYIVVFPILVRLACRAQRKMIVDKAAASKKYDPEDMPKSWYPTLKEHLGFAFKDKRPLKVGKKEGAGPANRIVLLIIWALGLAFFVLAPVVNWWFALVGLLLFLGALIFGIRSANKVVTTRNKIYKRMMDIARSKLGTPQKFANNPKAVITVTEWRDYVKPQEVRFVVPTTFGMESEEGFLRQFNQVFGSETAWVPKDDPEKGTSGWDYEEGLVVLRAVPPLPQKAPWNPHYIEDPRIAWSFFPLALGVENGVEVENPETGQVENVLGFDLSGLQSKVEGIKVAPKLGSAAPMVLIAGGTGSGKALEVDTPVVVVHMAPHKPELNEITQVEGLSHA